MAREHVYLIGIGGTGMTALAGLLHERGCRVTGSDRSLYPPTSTILEALGLETHDRFDPANLDPPPDLVVVGNAISRGNPEVEAVLDRKIPYTSMPRLVSERFLADRHSLVVAGTHGKTTTSALLAWVLAHAGRDPGFLIGGLPRNFDRPFRAGGGSCFVIEGDEYDSAFFDKGPKFMHYRPDTALIGTVEFDHADIYRDLEQVRTAFGRLVNIVPGSGLVIGNADCEVTRELLAVAPCKVEGYGFTSGDWRAIDFEESERGARFRVLRDGKAYLDAAMKLSGEHNVRNALAVVAAATSRGLSAAEVAAGLESFEGVRRRLELRGEAAGVTVLDDFAHHPTAIDTTLRAVRQRYRGGRVWAVVEPRSWSLRRSVFQERLVEAFDAADEIIIADVYRAEEIPPHERLDPRRLVADLAARGRRARFLPDAETIAAEVGAAAGAGDVVTVMSNGAFDGLHDRLLRKLRARVGASSRR